MFIIERLTGVAVFSATLLLAVLLLYNTKIESGKIFRGYMIALTIMAFFYVPYETADLYRIKEMMTEFASYGIGGFITEYVCTSSTPAARLLYFFVGKTGVLSLLPAISCVVTYACTFYVLERSAQIYKIHRKNIAIVLFFLMSMGTFIMVISNIRTMMAVSMIGFCFFRESVERKYQKKHLLLYMIAVMMHNLAVVVLCVRVVAFAIDRQLYPKTKEAYKKIGMICLIVGIIFHGVIFDILEKVFEYIIGDSYSYFWDYLIGIIVAGVEAYILYYVWNLKRKKQKRIKETLIYASACMCLALLFCFEFSIFHRLITYVVPILTVPLMLIVLENELYKEERVGQKGKVRKNIFLISTILLLLSCSRGSLCALKFFVLP